MSCRWHGRWRWRIRAAWLVLRSRSVIYGVHFTGPGEATSRDGRPLVLHSCLFDGASADLPVGTFPADEGNRLHMGILAPYFGED